MHLTLDKDRCKNTDRMSNVSTFNCEKHTESQLQLRVSSFTQWKVQFSVVNKRNRCKFKQGSHMRILPNWSQICPFVYSYTDNIFLFLEPIIMIKCKEKGMIPYTHPYGCLFDSKYRFFLTRKPQGNNSECDPTLTVVTQFKSFKNNPKFYYDHSTKTANYITNSISYPSGR